MRVLAIDPGLVNLAFCDITAFDTECECTTINDWGVVTLITKKTKTIKPITVDRMYDTLTKLFPPSLVREFDVISIERQMSRRMLQIAHYIEMYMRCFSKARVESTSASLKLQWGRTCLLKHLSEHLSEQNHHDNLNHNLNQHSNLKNLNQNLKPNLPQKTVYRRRKAESIYYARLYLESQEPQLLDEFDGHQKRDDLADTLLQAHAVIYTR